MPQGGKGIAPFIALGLHVSELMEMHDKASQQIVMRFCKMYPPQKIVEISLDTMIRI